jgi:1,4-dihydroxy-2-naphthoyl-CoA hydrolase
MSFEYSRTIRFHETDAAGVLYFANLFVICHEAYEASLESAGIPVRTFFSQQAAVALPIVQTSATFRQPLHCGDRVQIQLLPQQLTRLSFAINYQVFLAAPATAGLVGEAYTRHVCIDPINRDRQSLPQDLLVWLEQ